VGLDLDLEALNWCLENNLGKTGADGYSRIFLYHGNVLQPRKARLVKNTVQDLTKLEIASVQDDSLETVGLGGGSNSAIQVTSTMEEAVLPARDIICAFNYSCCCLQSRDDLVLYFKHVLHFLSKRGGIFVMDIYGGTSSERKLRLQRRFSNFTVSCLPLNAFRNALETAPFNADLTKMFKFASEYNLESCKLDYISWIKWTLQSDI